MNEHIPDRLNPQNFVMTQKSDIQSGTNLNPSGEDQQISFPGMPIKSEESL